MEKLIYWGFLNQAMGVENDEMRDKMTPHPKRYIYKDFKSRCMDKKPRFWGSHV
jgi:hypothetical protein